VDCNVLANVVAQISLRVCGQSFSQTHSERTESSCISKLFTVSAGAASC